MTGRRSRIKGSAGEREFFELSNKAVEGLEWPYRDRQGRVFFRHPAPRHGHGQSDNSDPHGVLPVTIEVKRVEQPRFLDWFTKLLDNARPTQTPVLAWRRNNKPWLVLPLLDENEWREFLRWKLQRATSASQQSQS